MPEQIPFISIFLSSPGDVSERDLAEQVVKEVGNEAEFRDHFSLRLYRWDDEEVVVPMEATETPQQSVNTYMKKPSDCDLVVVMFWSRMGTPLIMDKQEYLSGTHYEYMDGVEGRKKQGKPSVWLYRCTRKPTLDMSDPEAFKKLEQFQLVNEFFKSFEDDAGRYTGGVNFYESGDEFADVFGKQLRVFLRRLKENPHAKRVPEREVKQVYTGKPYPGLEALNNEAIFFGRERETLDVLALLDQQRVVFLIGASGSGKSSLAAAGVVPRLERRNGWQVIRFTPGSDPYLSLAKGLVKGLAEIDIEPLERLNKAKEIAQQLQANKSSLVDLLELLTDDKVLLFADQFEELFTLTNDTDRASFADVLKHDAPQIRVLATMRADFYENATPYFEKNLRQNFTLSQPSPFALYEMITRPAELAGLSFDSGLPEQIITDLGDSAGALALMAYLLEQLYIREQPRHDGVLRGGDYKDLGGVQQAIGTHAEHIYQQLAADDEDKEAWLHRVFHELVSVDERGTATRRRVSLERITEADMPFVDRFAAQDARLLVKGQDTLEVAHEALFRSWQRLKNWITEAQEDLILLRQVRTSAEDWHKRERPDFLLWPQERLVLVYAMQERLHPELNEIERDFIEPEQERLYRELQVIETTHQRRYDIGERLARIGDYRKGIGLLKNGLPDIEWLSAMGGLIRIGGTNFKVEPFYISKYLITHTQFQAFVESGEYDDLRWWLGFGEKYQLPTEATNSNSNAPRDSIGWYQCIAFSRWLNDKFMGLKLPHPSGHGDLIVGETSQIRLPTEWEWQFVAQNSFENRSYPWGEWDNEIRTNTTEAGINDRSTAVGMYPAGNAACGALDMSGNLWEWCLNDHGNPSAISVKSTEFKALRGGSFYNPQSLASCAYRGNRIPREERNYIGMRCVLSSLIPL